MGIRNIVGSSFKSLIDFRRWMSWDSVKQQGKSITNYRDTFKVEEPEHQETFEAAKKRLDLTEESLKEKAKNCFFLALVYLGFGLILLAYTVYLFSEGHWRAVILGLVVTFVAFTFAFREHFCYFQIKRAKLGCTVKEWLRFVLSGGRS